MHAPREPGLTLHSFAAEDAHCSVGDVYGPCNNLPDPGVSAKFEEFSKAIQQWAEQRRT